MMPTQGQGQQPPANINQFQDTMMNVVYNVCSIVTLPVEMALRPQYGSRYFPPVILFFSAVMMMVLPVLSEMASGFSRMLPFGGFQMESGMFGMEAPVQGLLPGELHPRLSHMAAHAAHGAGGKQRL